MAYKFDIDNFTMNESAAFYGSSVDCSPIYPGVWSGVGIADVSAVAEKFKRLRRPKIYCASLDVFPLPQLRGQFPDSFFVSFEVCVREWIRDLDLEPGIYPLDGDYLIIGARAPRPVVKPRPRRGLTKLVWSKPNRAARREKGRKLGYDYDL